MSTGAGVAPSAHRVPPNLPRGALKSYLLAHVRRHRRAVAVALAAVFLGGAAVATAPLLLRTAIDDGIRVGDETVLLLAGAAYLVVLAAGGFVGAVRSVATATLGQDLLHVVRTDAVRGVLRTDLADFESADRGDLQARVTSDVESLAGASSDLLPDMLGHLIAVAGGIAAILLLSPGLALVVCVFVPPAVLAGWWLLRRAQAVYPELFRRNASAVGVLVETIEGSATIAAHRASERRLALLQSRSDALREQALRAAAMTNWFYSTLLVLQSLATAAVVVGAAMLADRGSISVGTATAAVVALTGVFGPLSWLLGGLDEVLRARAALVRVAELAVLAEPPVGSGVVLPVRGPLEFRAVSYSYGAGPPAVSDIDLVVAPGERVAIVGPTGSGKSTLGRLAVGLASPTSGTVRLADVDVAIADDRDLRLVLCTQETYLVGGTIAENVRLARPRLSDDELRRAASVLGIAAWIDSLPAGYETQVGPDGALVSFGERQLVSLLRATVCDPAVLVLDESTSVLDPATEALVAEALDRATAGRVVLVIAHRPATAARCDRVVAVDCGRLVAGEPSPGNGCPR